MVQQEFHEITPVIEELAAKAQAADVIDSSLYAEYDVKRGLRDLNGVGVLAGLTHVSQVRATKVVDGVKVPDYGQLIYRGYDIKDLVHGILDSGRFGYEEVAYLLLFGDLPNEEELKMFSETLAEYRELPTGFVRDVIMKKPSLHIMNTLSRSVLTLYAYDDDGNDISLPGIVRQSLELIARFPQLSVYGYYAFQHEKGDGSLYIIPPLPDGSFAENLLHILRPDGNYTETEARVLDACLLLHMDHGGGNNSTFTTHVVSSTNTDLYSVIAAALGALKGPRHGGANIMVTQMFADLEKNVHDWKDDDEVSAYLKKLLHKEAFDKSGLIYGVGHAVYSSPTPVRRSSRASPNCSPRRRDAPKSTTCTGRWRSLHRRSSRASGTCTKVPARTSTSTPASSTRCSACRKSCLPRSSPWPVSSAGVPTSSKSTPTTRRSSGLRTTASSPSARMSTSKTGKAAPSSLHSCKLGLAFLQ